MLVTTFFHYYLSLRPTELPLPLCLPPSIRMKLPKGGHNPLPGAPPHAQPGPAEWASPPLDRWPQRAEQPSGTLAVRPCATASSQCGMWASETTYQQGGNRVADGDPSLPARPALTGPLHFFLVLNQQGVTVRNTGTTKNAFQQGDLLSSWS